jgi:DNA-binding response OmpR family regulator
MSGERILIVDDEELVRRVLKDSLELDRAAYEVFTASSGIGLLSHARSLQPHVVLLDLMLGPGPNGLDVCRQLRGDERLATCGIIVVTGRLDAGDEHRALFAGADLCVRKDALKPHVLLTNVREMIRVVRGRVEPVRVLEGLVLSREERSAWHLEQRLEFTPLKFLIVWRLCECPGRVVGYRELLEHDPTTPIERSRHVAHAKMSTIRRRLGPLGCHIETVRGKGYRWRPAAHEPSVTG